MAPPRQRVQTALRKPDIARNIIKPFYQSFILSLRGRPNAAWTILDTANLSRALRKALLGCLDLAADIDQRLLRTDGQHYGLTDEKPSQPLDFSTDECEIWLNGRHLEEALECIQTTANRHRQGCSAQCPAVYEMLCYCLRYRASSSWAYKNVYRYMLVRGLLPVYVNDLPSSGPPMTLGQKVSFVMHVVHELIPRGSGLYTRLSEYVACVSCLVEIPQLGLHQHRRLLLMTTQKSPEVKWSDLCSSAAQAVEGAMRVKDRLAFLVCAEILLEAGTKLAWHSQTRHTYPEVAHELLNTSTVDETATFFWFAKCAVNSTEAKPHYPVRYATALARRICRALCSKRQRRQSHTANRCGIDVDRLTMPSSGRDLLDETTAAAVKHIFRVSTVQELRDLVEEATQRAVRHWLSECGSDLSVASVRS